MLARQRHAKSRRQVAGDTIVEVMVALAVLGLAIGLSYATASRSLLAARQAQESSTASELLQGQLEALRSMAPNSSTATPSTDVYDTNPFCISGGAVTDNTDTINYPKKCLIDSLYTIAITNTASTGDFKLQITWEDVSGDGTQDSATFFYRVYKNA